MKITHEAKGQTAYIGEIECYVMGFKFGRVILRPKNINITVSYSIPEAELSRHLV
jgi:hypothetical protein